MPRIRVKGIPAAIIAVMFYFAAAGTCEAIAVLKSEKIQEENGKISVEIRYPVTANTQVNRATEKWTKAELSRFKASVPENPENPDWKFHLTISYSCSEFSSRIASFLFRIESFTGGAHPYPRIRAVTYDLRTAREIQLEDIFKGRGSIRRISDLAIAEILKDQRVTDRDWVLRGAGPRWDNFQYFMLHPEKIVFYFAPYQVAPYYLGEKRVEIRWGRIREYVREEFRRE
ncbi:MAG TPA: DUF3298 domain-containing protein [Syntrophales bacterium]|nr:DUF3298 domain-containing protein [Syntrophales bacterium]